MSTAPPGIGQRRTVCPAMRRFRVAVPFALIGLSLWLLVGCLNFPTGDNVHLTGSKKDFRLMPSYDADQKPQVAGRFTRKRIEALLGRPPYLSRNGRRVMYVIHVKRGIVIMPVCFTAMDEIDRAFGLVLTFDERGMLQGWKQVDAFGRYSLLHGGPNGPTAAFRLQNFSEEFLVDSANEADRPTTSTSSLDRVPDPWALKPRLASK